MQIRCHLQNIFVHGCQRDSCKPKQHVYTSVKKFRSMYFSLSLSPQVQIPPLSLSLIFIPLESRHSYLRFQKPSYSRFTFPSLGNSSPSPQEYAFIQSLSTQHHGALPATLRPAFFKNILLSPPLSSLLFLFLVITLSLSVFFSRSYSNPISPLLTQSF